MPIDVIAKRLEWDDANQRPALPRSLSNEQEKRIRDLFVTRARYVEPFPEAHIKRAVAISQERPPPPPPPPPAPLRVPIPATPSQDASQAAVSSFGNSGVALAIAVMCVAIMCFLSSFVSRKVAGEQLSFGARVVVLTLVAFVSTAGLHALGIVDEFKLLSVSLVGGLSVGLLFSIKDL
jgi:hypothetical protein